MNYQSFNHQINIRIGNYIALLLAFVLFGCSSPPDKEQQSATNEISDQLPYFKYEKQNLFPGDASLLRAEDGVALDDGRIIVVDQAHGLRLIEQDGSNRPFGDFEAVGFVHDPPNIVASPNGIFLEPNREYVIMSDVADGKIYRVNISTENVDLIYDHPFGVNTIYRDRTGALWFTQSTASTNLDELFRDVNLPVPHGAVYRMADLKSQPALIADSIYFANGICMDEEEKTLYVAESMMDRIHHFDVDVSTGIAQYAGIAANVGTPDNLLIDQKGRLVVASPLYNQVVVIDFKNHSQHILFDGSTKDNLKVTDEWTRRSRLGMERLELLNPDLFSPLPGLVTGMFFSIDGQTLYVTNLGNDLLKFEY